MRLTLIVVSAQRTLIFISHTSLLLVASLINAVLGKSTYVINSTYSINKRFFRYEMLLAISVKNFVIFLTEKFK
jgi:hypothetical protein